MHEFLSFNFPLLEYFFRTSSAPRPPLPPPPDKFSNGPSLKQGLKSTGSQ